jgi:hypothetical protein
MKRTRKAMRVPSEWERFRVTDGRLASDESYGPNGAFIPTDGPLIGACILVSNGGGWEHASVSFPDRCPTWDEMSLVKSVFWDEDACVVQYHPPKADYVNFHPFCLHLWRPTKQRIPRPPARFVGPR